MTVKIGSVSPQGPADGPPPSPPSPDLSGDGWEYWYKTLLLTGKDNVRGDGVLRLRKSIFVRIVWDAGTGTDRCTVTTDKTSKTAYLEGPRPVTDPNELFELIGRWVPQIEHDVLGPS